MVEGICRPRLFGGRLQGRRYFRMRKGYSGLITGNYAAHKDTGNPYPERPWHRSHPAVVPGVTVLDGCNIVGIRQRRNHANGQDIPGWLPGTKTRFPVKHWQPTRKRHQGRHIPTSTANLRQMVFISAMVANRSLLRRSMGEVQKPGKYATPSSTFRKKARPDGNCIGFAKYISVQPQGNRQPSNFESTRLPCKRHGARPPKRSAGLFST